MVFQTDFSLSLGKDELFEIESTYKLQEAVPSAFLETVTVQLRSLIPPIFFEEVDLFSDAESLRLAFQKLYSELPLTHLEPQTTQLPGAISASFLCPALFAHGVGRYIKDTLSRWLIPGEQIAIVGEMGLNFYFKKQPDLKFYFAHFLVGVSNSNEKAEILKNMPLVLEEMKLNITASVQANHIISLKSYTSSYKSLLIEERFNSLFHRSDYSLYEQIQILVSQHSSEEKIREVKGNLNHLLQMRPRTFDRSIFYEMMQITACINNRCSRGRNARTISRIITHCYLFRKFIESQVKNAPQERHLSLKITPLKMAEGGFGISCLMVLNFLKDSERFEKSHLIDALKVCLPNHACIDRFFLSDRKDGRILFVYAEFTKASGERFSLLEIKTLKKELPFEVSRSIEKIIHPVFMPRNEEELLRNLVLLSREIKYVRDLPQVSIHYQTQTSSQLIFTVLLVRLKKQNSLCLHQLFQETDLYVDIDDVRMLAPLKRKYPKEAAILQVSIGKTSFFRRDFSVDLLRARHKIALELSHILGEFRDFNGGMILKQEEVLIELRQAFGALNPRDEFLLENYFYSIRPVIAQTVYDPMVFKAHFELLIGCIDFNLKDSSHYLAHGAHENYELYWTASRKMVSQTDARKEINQWKSDPHAWAYCCFHFDHIALLGFIIKNDQADVVEEFDLKIKALHKDLLAH